jgi:tRNA nucleotidyltransferase (CCA-adding enzyme)
VKEKWQRYKERTSQYDCGIILNNSFLRSQQLSTTINLDSKLKKYLPAELADFMHIIGEIADKRGFGLFLVGGVVRDLLLGHPNYDIDMVVEGDAIALTRSLPLQKSKTEVHTSFGTAKYKFGKWAIDLATARSESYETPGILPAVKPSDIKTDLLRRDFTINAMAISLNPGNYGELIDPNNGIIDLKRKLIRILHEKSFVDDATRIWRAIRYEQRLDFEIEKETLRLLKRGLNMLDTISGDRIRHELEIVLREKEPEKIFRRADELKVISKIHSNLKGNEDLAEKFEEARQLGLIDTSLSMVYFALLIYQLKIEEFEIVSSNLNFNKKLNKLLKETIELENILPSLDKQDLLPSEIYFILFQYSELAIIANSISINSVTIKRNIDDYLTKLRHIKPRLNGDDLKRMNIVEGPEIKRILNMLHAARLDGKVNTKQGEIRLVYSWLGKYRK